jgi:ATP-binding cassette subfamily B protein
MNPNGKRTAPPSGPNIFGILKPYRLLIGILAILSVATNGISLWLPKVMSHAIDAYAHRSLVLSGVAWEFGLLSFAIFILTYMQNIVQTYASELVAKDLRNSLAAKISQQSHLFIQKVTPSKLLTNLTSDIDAVKLFVAQAIASLISSAFLIVGASTLLLLTNWKLGLAVLVLVPAIGVTFFLTLGKVRALFFKSREIIDRLNQVINESILGSSLVRVLHSQTTEFNKFEAANADSRDLGLKIVGIFSGLIPSITFIASLSSIVILAYGGHLVITAGMSLGDFAAFSSYMAILIFPILIIGFMSNVIAQASASYGRVAEVLTSKEPEEIGLITKKLKGDISVEGLSLSYGEKKALTAISFSIKAGTRTAIIGPTAAGKTQLLYALTGLVMPDTGTVSFDGHLLSEYNREALHQQIGLVFQDSIVFNMSLRENIAFSTTVTDADLEKAIQTAELGDLIDSLPEKLDTIVSERGTTLSGGQKQRLMLARALALNPRILLLDDFTARVDSGTEAKILDNVTKNYPEVTIISVTQKVSSVEKYDQIIVLMEGELLSQGTHKELLKSSTEYMQIYSSQQSTNTYELHA